MSLASEATAAYGQDFVPVAEQVCGRLGIPVQWLLAAIYWETTHFKANGPPWPRNKSDGGGGLIGFTPLKGHPAENKGPVEQLPLVEQHYRYWMSKLKISKFQSPEDLYLIVRGPYGIGQPDSFNMGGGLNKGQVLKIYRDYLTTVGISSSLTSGTPSFGTRGAVLVASGAGIASAVTPFAVRKGFARTTGTQIRVHSGPGLHFPTLRFLVPSGTRIEVLDQVRGDIVNGNNLWDKINAGYVSDAYVAFEGQWA
jgi:hypothetical protein